jgi:hypothetical protein
MSEKASNQSPKRIQKLPRLGKKIRLVGLGSSLDIPPFNVPDHAVNAFIGPYRVDRDIWVRLPKHTKNLIGKRFGQFPERP